jgi:hypothetical protein
MHIHPPECIDQPGLSFHFPHFLGVLNILGDRAGSTCLPDASLFDGGSLHVLTSLFRCIACVGAGICFMDWWAIMGIYLHEGLGRFTCTRRIWF